MSRDGVTSEEVGCDPPAFPASERVPPLLAALERPDQFVAAHLALVWLDGGGFDY